ncbi:MAG TPA: hypothetical protein VF553_11575 [Pyrinomonadaceae bacterium]|jgi:hypothetical protein
MTVDWSPLTTSTHQDHVVAHVIGATVLGYFKTEQAIHLLLDMGFIWMIYVDCEMGLLPQSVAISELEVDEDVRSRLGREAQRLHDDGRAAEGLLEFSAAPADCLITEVSLEARGDERRILIRGEESTLAIETSLVTGEARLQAHPV